MTFVPTSGLFYAHLHENPLTGLARGLFWNIFIELEPVEWEGEQWNCAFACDWLDWPIRRLSELDGIDLKQVLHPDEVECSIYLVAEHHFVTLNDLTIQRREDASYWINAVGQADLEIDDTTLSSAFDIQCELKFEGVIVVPDSLSPSPKNATEVTDALVPFFDLDGLGTPRWDEFRYVLDAVG